MARSLRWTEKELAQHLGRVSGVQSPPSDSDRASRLAPPAPSAAAVRASPTREVGPSISNTAKPKASEPTDAKDNIRPKKTVGSRAKEAAHTLKLAQISGMHQTGEFLEFTLDGARLLSVNELYALHHFQRIAYRKAWHEAIQAAVLVVTGGPRHWLKFDRFTVVVHRRARAGCDVDALNGHFKYAIDGLRYAGLIVDDDPAHMLSMSSTQEKGKPLVHIRVERATQAIKEGNTRLTGAKAGAMTHPWSGLQQGAEPDQKIHKTTPEGAGGG